MILHQHVIKGAVTPITICPIGDIQWAGDRGDLAFDHLTEHIQACLDLPTPLFIGPGDYIDFASPSNREALRASRVYPTARKVIQDAVKALVNDLYTKVLKPTTGKWLGLVNGHHHYDTVADGNSDAYLSQLLKAQFYQEFGYVQIKWTGGGEINLVIYHGDGSSVFPWGPLNKLYHIAPNFMADVLFMGHQTKKAVGEFDRMTPVFNDGPARLDHQTVHLVGTGGWTKGYINGRVTYISEKALNPVALGAPIVHVRPRWRTTTATGAKVWDPRITVEV